MSNNFRERRELFFIKLAAVFHREQIASDDPEKWMKLAIALLHQYEPGFQTETRGRFKRDSRAKFEAELAANTASIELAVLKEELDKRHRESGLDPLSDVAFASHFAKEVNQEKLPPVYRGKSRETLRKYLFRGKALKESTNTPPRLGKK